MNDNGFDINEPIEMDDLSTQTSEDVLDPVRRVPFVVKKATIRTQLEDNKHVQSEDNRWKVKRLALQLAIGTEGTDGEGKYKGKYLFPELILTFNVADFPEQYSTEYYQKRARADTKAFFQALGFDVKALPTITDEFLVDLIDREVIADITRKERRTFNPETEEWEGTGEYINNITNYKVVPVHTNGNAA